MGECGDNTPPITANKSQVTRFHLLQVNTISANLRQEFRGKASFFHRPRRKQDKPRHDCNTRNTSNRHHPLYLSLPEQSFGYSFAISGVSYNPYFQLLTLTPAFACVDTKTCRSAFIASQVSTSYWSKLVPAAHLSRPAPWHSYSPSELRGAHIRYAATTRRWKSSLPTFKSPLRLPPPKGSSGHLDCPQRWRPIRGTHWAWSLRHSTGEVRFCDLRAGRVIGQWNAGGRVLDALLESRSPNECILCYWKTDKADDTGEYVPVLNCMS